MREKVGSSSVLFKKGSGVDILLSSEAADGMGELTLMLITLSQRWIRAELNYFGDMLIPNSKAVVEPPW